MTTITQQASTLISLLSPLSSLSATSKSLWVWLGDGLSQQNDEVGIHGYGGFSPEIVTPNI